MSKQVVHATLGRREQAEVERPGATLSRSDRNTFCVGSNGTILILNNATEIPSRGLSSLGDRGMKGCCETTSLGGVLG